MASAPDSGSLMDYLPDFLKDRSIGIPIIVGIYVVVLGLVLTGALNRQKVAIDRAKKERNPMFSMLDEDEDKDS